MMHHDPGKITKIMRLLLVIVAKHWETKLRFFHKENPPRCHGEAPSRCFNKAKDMCLCLIVLSMFSSMFVLIHIYHEARSSVHN